LKLSSNALLSILIAVAVVSAPLWIISKVQYSVIGNFDIFVFTDYRAVLALVLSILVFVVMVMRYEKADRLPLIFLLIIIPLYVIPLLVNVPNLLHRDVYLHNSYSLAIIQNGRIPIDESRWDVYSYPAAFLLYAIHMAVTGLDFFYSGLMLTCLWPILFALLLAFAVRRIGKMGKKFKPSLIALSLIPFAFARYTPAPGFFHRYHLAFSLTVIWLTFFLNEYSLKRTKKDVLTLILLYMCIVFSHPYFSILIASVVAFNFLLSIASTRSRRTEGWTFMLILIVGFLSHLLFLASPALILEAYSTIVQPKLQWMEFMEQSAPVYVSSNVPLALQYLAVYERLIWRIAVLGILSLTILEILTHLARRHLQPSFSALFLMLSAVLLSVPLISSFLWWERSLSILGLSAFFALLMFSTSDTSLMNKSRIFKAFLLVLLFTGAVIAPFARYERSVFEGMWRSPAESSALLFVAENSADGSIYAGSSTGVVFTYYRMRYDPSLTVNTIFDVVKGVLKISPETLSSPYVFSLADPDYNHLNMSQLLERKSLIFIDGLYYIIT